MKPITRLTIIWLALIALALVSYTAASKRWYLSIKDSIAEIDQGSLVSISDSEAIDLGSKPEIIFDTVNWKITVVTDNPPGIFHYDIPEELLELIESKRELEKLKADVEALKARVNHGLPARIPQLTTQ